MKKLYKNYRKTTVGNLIKSLIVLLVLLFSNLALSQIENKSDSLEIWTLFSIGNFVNHNTEKILEKEWPFKIKGIAGDSFAEELIDSVEIHNNKIWDFLNSNGYSDSKKKFESDYIAEAGRINEALNLLNKNKILSELFQSLRKNKRQIYTELKKINDIKYEFTLYSFDQENTGKGQIFEKKFFVDLNEQKIEIIK